MPKIDVIIPAYNAEKTLGKALSSIAIQSISNDVRVTIVDDCSKDNTYLFDNQIMFRGLLDIQLLTTPQNGGPGVARQYGLDNTDGEFICFLDADDAFGGPFALEILLDKLKEPNVVLSVGVFFEKQKILNFVKHENDMVWLHGKMYRRSFLDKYGIRFNKTRANEDVGFNTKIKLLENENERIVFSPNLVYYWQWNEGGITRINDFEYTYNQSYFGYVDNQIDAIKFAIDKMGKDDEFLLGYTLEVLAFIYVYLLRIRWHRQDLEPQAWEYARKYFEEVMKPLNYDSISDQQHDEIISVSYASHMGYLKGRIIDMTFHEFMEILLA